MKRSLVLALILLTTCATYAKKKKNNFPAWILQAHYVAVVTDPEQGISLTNPGEKQAALTDVRTELEKWGRFTLTNDTLNADLILVVHRGGRTAKPSVGPTLSDPPIIGSNGGVNIGIGRRPPLSSTEVDQSSSPSPRMEVGSAEDILSVYRGHDQYPLDSPPLWRYGAKNAFQAPGVPAVQKLKKDIEDAEKAKP